MQEHSEKYNSMEDDAEATLVTPRFDAEEARHAHPVVPLVEAEPRAPFRNRRAYARRGLRRSWSPALLAVVLLAAVAVGGVVATKVLRRTSTDPTAQAPAALAPAQATEAPAQADAPPAVEPTREVAGAKPEARPTRVAPSRRAEDAGGLSQAAAARDDSEDLSVEDESRRGKGHGKRRSRDGDDGEKEMRKILKRAKDKAPRLVDVLVGPRN